MFSLFKHILLRVKTTQTQTELYMYYQSLNITCEDTRMKTFERIKCVKYYYLIYQASMNQQQIVYY
jgi:hypothetical protein